MKKKIKSLLQRVKGNGGFTLIELIIVIAIMGFLVAMIAPRLANVATGASDNVCDTNQQRLRQVVAAYTENYGQLPNYLTNLVIATGTHTEEIPTNYYATDTEGYIDNNDKTDGKEALSVDMNDMVHLKLHKLTAAEADELKGLGITKVYNLNLSKKVDGEYNGPEADSGNTYMQQVPVKAGLAVLMCGAGYDGASWDTSDLSEGGIFGNPDLAYRIVLGVGQDSALVKEGQIQTAALCPNGMRRGDHFLYNNYNIVLPRLAATLDRSGDGNVDVPVTDITVKDETGEVKSYNLTEAQEVWQFSTFCPEGCQLMGAGGPSLTITSLTTQ